MKTRKLSFIKRIFVFFCCTVLLSSSVFASYNITVYAADDDFDFGIAVIDVVLIIAGVIEIAVSGGTLSPVAAAQIAVSLTSGGKEIYDYLSDNGDGTYTIDPTFVQAVMDAAEQLEAQGFTDTDITKQNNGRYSIHYSTFYNKFWCSKHTDTIESCKIEGLISVISGRSAIFVSGPSEDTGTYSLSIGYEYGAQYLVEYRRQTFACGYTRNTDLLCGNTYGANIPIFSDSVAYKNYLSTGAGYKNAENYRPAPLFRRHSSYTPTYSGGSVTVNRTVIQNIASKIAEVDADDSKTDDEKIEILQKYILSGGTPDVGGGGDKDYDDNKDLPSGSDLTDTNSWIKKIYLKVCQIFDKMTSSAGQTLDDVVTAIEDLSQMLKRYLSEITGDLDDIKGQLEDMSEQEFNDKTDSFLSQLMDLFSEISETAKGKFPFSIPSDIQFLIARISGVSPETAASYSYDENTVSSLSFNSDISLNSVSENDGTDHGGGGSSRPGDETEPPGGGGASRPGGSGFVSVEHGGGGSGREPVSSNNWAPVFTLPIVIERYGIEEYIILDMSMFDPVSKMSRTLFLIMYIVCLYNMTFKVMGLWGDLVG